MTKRAAVFLIVTFFAIIFGALIFSYFKLMPGSNGDSTDNPSFRGFFPFGDDFSETIEPESSDVNVGSASVYPKLRKISAEPVVAFTTYTVSSSTSTSTPAKNMFRFMTRSTGHVFDIAEDSSELIRVTNTTIPRLQEAQFFDKENVVVRFLKNDNETKETFLGKIVKNETGDELSLEGIYLSPDIIDIAVSKTGKLFYLVGTQTGSSGTVVDLKTNKATKVFDSPLREWRFSWAGDNSIIYFTKPSSSIPGYLFSLDLKTGLTKKRMANVYGLVAKAGPTINDVLYSENKSGKVVLSQSNLISGVFSEKSISTLSDKCVWNTSFAYCAAPKKTISGNMPDSWYKGQVSFSDNLWKLDMTGDSVGYLVSLSDLSGEDIDAVNLEVSPDEKFLLFMNKKDGSLWSLRLEGLDAALE